MIKIDSLEQIKEIERSGELIGEFDIDDKIYHHKDCPGISRSKLKTMLRSYNHYLYQEMKETKALLVGRALHDAILMDNLDQYITFDGDRRTKAGKAEYAEMQESGKTFLDKVDLAIVKGIYKAVNEHMTCRNIMKDATNERAFFWRDHDTGILCKCKPDILKRDMGIIADIKSTDDARQSAFIRSVTKFDYDMQAAFYLDGVNAFLGEDTVKHFIFIGCEKFTPFEIGLYVLDQDSVTTGREVYKEALKYYKNCLEKADKEKGYSKQIRTISLASWAQDINNRI